MKLIIAFIKPFKLEQVRDALKTAGVSGMSASDVSGFGRQGGQTEVYRGAEYVVNFLPKVKIEAVLDDALVDRVIEAVQKAAATGKIGDGKIFIVDVAAAIRIRNGDRGEAAL